MGNILTELQAAYIAGIIDGEGCIYISKSKVRSEIGMKHAYYRVGVEVKNTDERMIDFLHKCLGGHKSLQKRQTTNNRQVYVWAAADKDAVVILRLLYEYLQCKKEQVDLIFQLRDTFNQSYSREKNEIPAWILQFREDCYNQIKKLHFVFTGKGKR